MKGLLFWALKMEFGGDIAELVSEIVSICISFIASGMNVKPNSSAENTCVCVCVYTRPLS